MKLKYLLLLLFLLLSGCDKSSFSYNSGASQLQQKTQLDLVELQSHLNVLQQQLLMGINVPDKFYPSGLTGLLQVSSLSERVAQDLKSLKSYDTAGLQHELKKYTAIIAKNNQYLASRAIVVKGLSTNIANLAYIIPGLIATTDELADIEVKHSANSATIYIITRQFMLLQRIRANAEKFIHPNFDKPDAPVAAADRLGRDAQLLLAVYSGLKSGDKKYRIPRLRSKAAQNKLDRIMKLSPDLKKAVIAILDNGPEYFQYNSTLLSLSGACNSMSDVVFKLQKTMLSGNTSRHLLLP